MKTVRFMLRKIDQSNPSKESQESSMLRRIPWQDVCKFLAGAFFVNVGILFYLYLAGVSGPLLGTGFY
jgi:hypothetical protein